MKHRDNVYTVNAQPTVHDRRRHDMQTQAHAAAISTVTVVNWSDSNNTTLTRLHASDRIILVYKKKKQVNK